MSYWLFMHSNSLGEPAQDIGRRLLPGLKYLTSSALLADSAVGLCKQGMQVLLGLELLHQEHVIYRSALGAL
jgi:hypothetical protein